MNEDSRLADLETRLMYQEAALEELSKNNYRQQTQIEEILAELKQIREFLTQLDSDAIQAAKHEIPPHY